MAFQAGQFEASKPFRRRRARRPVDSGNTLEGDAAQLPAHMREAFGVTIEVDEVDLHCASAQRFHSGSLSGERMLCHSPGAQRSDLHLRAELNDAIGRQIEEVRCACGLLRHGDEQLVLPLGHA